MPNKFKRESHMQRSNNRWKPSLALAACIAVSNSDFSSGFSQARSVRTDKSSPRTRSDGKRSHETRTSSKRHFRVGGDGLPYLETSTTNNLLNMDINTLPIWLRQNKGSDLTGLFEQLKTAILDEAEDIIALIKRLGEGDSNKMAGATQLCLILVETMDMGHETLVASVIHFFSCVDARERAHFLPRSKEETTHAFPFASLWDTSSLCSSVQVENMIDSYGVEVKTIVNDAAALKSTEMKAETIMQISDAESLRRLLLTESGDWRALAIRSAAALFRLRAIEEMKCDHDVQLSPEDKRVAKEALYIYAPLASGLGVRRLKEELEGVAFRVLYKRQYGNVSDLMKQPRMRHGIRGNECVNKNSSIQDSLLLLEEDVSEKLRLLLKNDIMLTRYAENIVVSARVKEPYSLWRKMVKNGVSNVLEVPDALALRITFDAKKEAEDEDIEVTRARERALCYYVQKLCREKWKPDSVDPRFKDYIKYPKKNGYQSLHYTAKTNFNADDWLFEIQVRSGEMHRVAEYGLAAHWDYKLQGKKGSDEQKKVYELDHSSEVYLKSVQEWNWKHGNTRSDFTSQMTCDSDSFCVGLDKNICERGSEKAEHRVHYIKHLSSVRSRLTRNQVMVFLTPSEGSSRYFDGKILSLPSGACIIDALKEGEKQFGITTNFWGFGVAQNGSEARLTQRLMNGDVLNIPATSGHNVFSV